MLQREKGGGTRDFHQQELVKVKEEAQSNDVNVQAKVAEITST
jgi:hypothetical protein